MAPRTALYLLLAALPVASAVAVGLYAALRRLYVTVDVQGASMEPTYRAGDRVLVRRSAPDRLRVGDVVVAEAPVDGAWPATLVRGAPRGRMWLIKRVAAVPGDPIPRDRVPALARVTEQRVPSGRVVLLGDADRGSWDSTTIGYFPLERVLGVVVRSLPSRSAEP